MTAETMNRARRAQTAVDDLGAGPPVTVTTPELADALGGVGIPHYRDVLDGLAKNPDSLDQLAEAIMGRLREPRTPSYYVAVAELVRAAIAFSDGNEKALVRDFPYSGHRLVEAVRAVRKAQRGRHGSMSAPKCAGRWPVAG